MKFSSTDFPIIRWSVIAICSAAVLGTIMLISSGKYADKTQSDLQSAQRASNDARNHLSAAYEDKENMAIYADEYGKLMARNIIGDDKRLDWIEGLEKLRKQNLVADFKYNIAPQKNYAPQPAITSGNFDIHYSEMKLSFDLLHEEQLLNFLTALRIQNIGWYQLDSCTLKRGENSGSANQVQLKAECTGGWIT
ncbi:MAG: hypothetical protein HOO95_00605, partial [Gallionella sp.]|nr:hypothetical protein [Gallionella sp.]